MDLQLFLSDEEGKMDLDLNSRGFIDLYDFGLEVCLLLLQLLGDLLL